MSAADISAVGGKQKSGFFSKLGVKRGDQDGAKAAAANSGTNDTSQQDALRPGIERKREKFIPITRFALMDRLTIPSAWPEQT